MLTREAFVTKRPELLPHKKHFDGLGEVYVRKLPASEYTEQVLQWTYPNGKLSKKRQRLINVRVIQLSVCDESGELLMQPSDLEAMADSMPQGVVETMVSYIVGTEVIQEDLGEQ